MPSTYEDIKKAKQLMLERMQDPNLSFAEKMQSSPEEQAVADSSLEMATMGTTKRPVVGAAEEGVAQTGLPGFEKVRRALRESGYFKDVAPEYIQSGAPGPTQVARTASKARDAVAQAYEEGSANFAKEPAFGKANSAAEYARRLQESSKAAQNLQRAKTLDRLKKASE